MIDSHCHLSGTVERCGFSTLEELKASAERWPEWTVDCGCETGEIDRTVALCEAHPDSMRFAVGIHPLEAESYRGEIEAKLVRLMSHPLCVAWGEIGLDLHGDGVPDLALQIEVCARQFAKAAAGIRFTFLGIVIRFRWIQPAKAPSPKRSTPGGRMISVTLSFPRKAVPAIAVTGGR